LLIDGLDQLDGQPEHGEIVQAACDLLDDPALAHVSLLLTGRTVPAPLTEREAYIVPIPTLTSQNAAAYLNSQAVPIAHQAALIDLADGNWLLLHLLTELHLHRSGDDSALDAIETEEIGTADGAATWRGV